MCRSYRHHTINVSSNSPRNLRFRWRETPWRMQVFKTRLVTTIFKLKVYCQALKVFFSRRLWCPVLVAEMIKSDENKYLWNLYVYVLSVRLYNLFMPWTAYEWSLSTATGSANSIICSNYNFIAVLTNSLICFLPSCIV